MKYTLSLLMFLISFHLFSQEIAPIKISIPKLSKSTFTTTFDSSTIKVNSVDSVVSKFGFTLLKTEERTRFYRAPFVLQELKLVNFTTYKYTAKSNNIYIFDKDSISLEKGQTIHVYGFTSTIVLSKKTLKNYSSILLSAYHQETDSSYVLNPNNFSTIQFKDKKTYQKRNLISMGYGLSYLDKNNPLADITNFEKGIFYLFDAVHYIPILGGGFFGETSNDKITIPIIGLVSLFIWKKIISEKFIGNRYILLHDEIKNSPYKIPNNLMY